jgi:hypothetical protein
MRALTSIRCAGVAWLLTLLCQPAWAGPIKDFTSVTDGVIWTQFGGTGSVLTDTANNVTTATVGGSTYELSVTNAQSLSGVYSFTFQAGFPTGTNLIFDAATLTAVPDSSNVPGGQSTGLPNLKISDSSDFLTCFANVDALTTGSVDLTGLNVRKLYFRVTAAVGSPLSAYSDFDLVAHSIQGPPPPPPAVPEPSTWGLLAVAGATLTLARRRR